MRILIVNGYSLNPDGKYQFEKYLEFIKEVARK